MVSDELESLKQRAKKLAMEKSGSSGSPVKPYKKHGYC
jgi:hypothetical protein